MEHISLHKNEHVRPSFIRQQSYVSTEKFSDIVLLYKY